MFILKYSIFTFLALIAGVSCSSAPKEKTGNAEKDTLRADSKVEIYLPDHLPVAKPTKSAMALYMDSLGLVNVAELDSTIAVRLMYTQADNFTGEVLYDNLSEAYLHPDAAKRLLAAQQNLRRIHPSYSLLIYDAARPMSVQKKMWKVVGGTSKSRYVSNPAHGGGLHNYGLAVDISIQDSLGNPLPMGTQVDHLGSEEHITQELEMVRNGKMSEAERQNRLLLRKVMKEAGFRPLPTEWWHYNYCSREVAKQKYKLIP